MSQERCKHRTVIDELEWYCNLDKGHEGDHMYNTVGLSNYGARIAKRWKQ